MKYSMDFKPRVVFGTRISQIVDFCFYDYNKHHDIKCYDKNGEEIPEKTVLKTFNSNIYYNESDLTYTIKKECYHDIGNVWVCRGWADSKKLLHFIGYSEISAIHAIEDCENSRKLILDRYYRKREE